LRAFDKRSCSSYFCKRGKSSFSKKSGGFDMEHTRLQHAQRIDHLLLAIAIATLWCHELGEFVLKHGDDSRCQVDPARQRTLSLFQLGLRWLKRVLATGFHFSPDFQAFLSNLKLMPVTMLASGSITVFPKPRDDIHRSNYLVVAAVALPPASSTIAKHPCGTAGATFPAKR
jgi:hypothetical protein